jgi:hypothetical protein
MQNTGVYTPAARQPKYQCSQCVRHFFNRAGLKNHIRAMHPTPQVASGSTGPTLSQVSGQLPSPNHSDSEEEPVHSDPILFKISDLESSATSPPQFLLDAAPMVVDEEMDENMEDEELHSHHDSGFNSPPIIPSSPGPRDQPSSNGHQQTSGNEKPVKRVYHDKLTGRFNIIPLLNLNSLGITSRSEM